MRERIRKLLKEARVVQTIPRSSRNLDDYDRFMAEKPFKIGETIRVYHGFNKFHDAINAALHGLSGKKMAGRAYSYEAGNNPVGLFVTLDFETAKEFVGAYSTSVIIEFQAKYEDLESPVWAGKGSYFLQGEYTQSFRNDKERKEAQAKARESAKTSDDERISQSDNPEVAHWLFGGEYQALFIGDLNPNGIRAFWVATENTYNAQYTRYSRQQFIEKFVKPELERIKDERKKSHNYSYGDKATQDDEKVFTPREDWNKEEFIRRIRDKYKRDSLGADSVEKTVREWLTDSTGRSIEYLQHYLYPKQLDQLYGKNKWRSFEGGWFDEGEIDWESIGK